MKPNLAFAGMLCALIAGKCVAAAPTLHDQSLPNGVRVCYLHAAGSKDFSVFTFLPMGLAFDDPGRTQWSHLVEHLVLRTTMPDDLTHANAETQPDHMRLDFYGDAHTWKDGLAHHAKWLGGLPFTEASVRVEPGRANSEADHVAKNLFTHKFAAAAWNQAVRHGAAHVAVKGDLLAADRAALEVYRDARLVVPSRMLVVMIGGVEPTVALAVAVEAFGAIKPAGTPAPKVVAKPGHRDATWDLDARHVLLAWPVPDPAKDAKSHAALLAIARIAMVNAAQDAELQTLAGPVLAGSDMTCPESNYFYISAGLRPGAEEADVRKRLADHVSKVVAKPEGAFPLRVLAEQLVIELGVADLDAWRAQAPNHMKPGMIEAQAAITWGTAEYRLGARRRDVASALKSLSAESVRAAGRTLLPPERCASVTLREKSSASDDDGF